MNVKKHVCKILFFLIASALIFTPAVAISQEKIGVLYAVHGGMEYNKQQYMFDAVIHQFSYDTNHAVHKIVSHGSAFWGNVLDRTTTDFAQRFGMMYDFGFQRMGGFDPYPRITDVHLAELQAHLDNSTKNPHGLDFMVDWVGYMAPEKPEHYAYPRYIYTAPDTSIFKDNLTYCGEKEPRDVVLDFADGTTAFTVGATLKGQLSGAQATIDGVTLDSGTWAGNDAAGFLSLSNVSGSFVDAEIVADNAALPDNGTATAVGTTHWPGCDPERHNVDGPAERMLKAGVTRIIIIDTTTTGVRFSKTYGPVEKTKFVVDEWNTANGTDIQVDWINDPKSLMKRSYPTEPAGWTRSLKDPDVDPSIPLEGNPNPWVEDPALAGLFIDGFETAFNPSVPDNKTAVLYFNHAVHDYNEWFDPKVNDTQILNKNIKAQLLARHPDMDPANIIGSFGGIQLYHDVSEQEERNRAQRGESYGHAWLYESDKELPGPADEWGFRYWEALQYLMDRGVEHIVVGFPQMLADDNLNMVELPNQIAKEIGYKTWQHWGYGDPALHPPDQVSYPQMGGYHHPFSDYWGNWVDTQCDDGAGGTLDCCFVMGGCPDNGTYANNGEYPPERQQELIVGGGPNTQLSDLDPSLCFDVSEYGQLGYDPLVGPPNPNAQVQGQYTGTWDMYRPPNDRPEVAELLAKHVLQTAYCGNGIVDPGEECGEPGLSCAVGATCMSNCQCDDNCPDVANPGQEDADSDGIGDACDADTLYGKVSGDADEGIDVSLYSVSCGADSLVATDTTDESGYYAFGDLNDVSVYKIMPEDADYTFIPDPFNTFSIYLQSGSREYDFTAESVTP